jgi:prepilin-type N-terminal cleavage/methylation domain-containing protein
MTLVGNMDKAASSKAGFTLVELLVCLFVIAILFSLLSSSIQSARGAARKLHCENNLRQQVLAAQHFASSNNRLPSTGIGLFWLAVRDFGQDVRQPGGWCYTLLPYLEQEPLYFLAPDIASLRRGELNTTPFVTAFSPTYSCPERYQRLVPCRPETVYFGIRAIENAANTDYAANAGTRAYEWRTGPSLLDYLNGETVQPVDADGPIHLASMIRYAEITDGLSNTILLGEKWKPLQGGRSLGMNQSHFSGDCLDIRRFSIYPPIIDGSTNPYFDSAFGSAHAGAAGFAMSDGSVRRIAYNVSIFTFMALGSINNGEIERLD